MLEGMEQPDLYGDLMSIHIDRILRAANWTARLFEDPPRLERREEHHTPRDVSQRPFGYDFPTPDQVNEDQS